MNIPFTAKVCPKCREMYWETAFHVCKPPQGRLPSADEQAGDRGDDKESDDE